MPDLEKLCQKMIFFDSSNFTSNVWGGNWIKTFKGLTSDGASPIGESWEFSGHRDHPSQVGVANGAKVFLPDLLAEKGLALLGERVMKKTQGAAPFLLKFIDAEDNLSIQVHPPDDYAKNHENDNGKAEAWFIMDSDPDPNRGFIYLGLKEKVTKEQVQKILTETPNKILPLLHKVKVKPGQLFDIAPGTLHAIGAGVRLFEIQQTSNVTYRVWDWDRPKKNRPLHVEKALDVIDFTSRSLEAYIQKFPFENKRAGFAVDQLILSSTEEKTLTPNGSFCVLSAIQGDATLQGENEKGVLKQGMTALIPASIDEVKLKAQTPHACVFKSYVPN